LGIILWIGGLGFKYSDFRKKCKFRSGLGWNLMENCKKIQSKNRKQKLEDKPKHQNLNSSGVVFAENSHK
jgi:hypothetical protein